MTTKNRIITLLSIIALMLCFEMAFTQNTQVNTSSLNRLPMLYIDGGTTINFTKDRIIGEITYYTFSAVDGFDQEGKPIVNLIYIKSYNKFTNYPDLYFEQMKNKIQLGYGKRFWIAYTPATRWVDKTLQGYNQFVNYF